MKNIQLHCDIFKNLSQKSYQKVTPMPLSNPKRVSINTLLAKQIGFDETTLDSKEFIDFINGTYIAKGSIPFGKAYSGHQFGYFVPNLGDGRAIHLGVKNNYHLQLKGAGITPYSRDGDGRAVLRSSIREYLMSEAMYGLGIATTRAVGIISSDTKVLRSYEQEPGSIVLRASSSWIRFGSFEYASFVSRSKEEIKTLADIVIQESYPHLQNSQNRYEELYFAVVDKTIDLIAKWQSIGFMHGVLNTDNMSIDGLTIDYGPYAMMEEFD